MAREGRTRLELEVGSYAESDLVVTALRGREALSEPFALEVRFHAASRDAIAVADLLAAEARLSIRRPGGDERVFHGEVDRARLTGVGDGVPEYEARIVPRLARLGHASRSRIFQDQTALDVVGKVLDGHRVKHRSATSGSYAVRPYVVQHQETDLAFVSRLLEEEGIAYLFEHGAGGHELVLFDGTEPGPKLAEPLPQRRPDQAEGEPHADRVASATRLASTGAALRDHDFVKPALDLAAAAGTKDLERYEYPGGYVAPAEGRRRAAVRLAEARGRAATWEGATNVLALVPGATFEIEDAAKLLCVAVVHEGAQDRHAGGAGASYRTAFEGVAAGTAWRPPRRAPRGEAPGLETATVVGPSGEEIHVDPDGHGRVKVHFHWDRDGKADDHASCWVRVTQRWAGPGMGASFVPRVGQEVLVRFVAGDGDRPIVVGAVYDRVNGPPLELPGHKTRSTQRTSSSPGGEGYNELRLEDAAGSEELHLHAQKDLNAVVEHDRRAEVRACDDVEVGKDLTHRIAGGRVTSVALDARTEIGGAQAITVMQALTDATGSDASLKVGAARTVSVAGTRAVGVALGSTETVYGAALHTVGGAYAVNVGVAENIAVGGARLEQVVGAKLELCAKDREEKVKGDRSTRTLGSERISIGEGAHVEAKDAKDVLGKDSTLEVTHEASLLADAFDLKAERFTVKVGGRELVTLKKAGGAVALELANLTIDGSSKIALKGAKITKDEGGSGSGKARQQQQAKDKGTVAVRLDIDPADAKHLADRFVLESSDGSYKQQKTIKDDKKDGDKALDLEFTDAPTDKKFKLKVVAGGNELVLMDGVAFNDIAAALSGDA